MKTPSLYFLPLFTFSALITLSSFAADVTATTSDPGKGVVDKYSFSRLPLTERKKLAATPGDTSQTDANNNNVVNGPKSKILLKAAESHKCKKYNNKLSPTNISGGQKNPSPELSAQLVRSPTDTTLHNSDGIQCDVNTE
ncbi:hypothetical protein [Collimonas pratensis]|uniref:hypothetical protein n=1 Tax=Collimonas pratensis TaxID=279113 RepID=UPI0012378375|nr:hypothetical protein [Collimonas pratensis]